MSDSRPSKVFTSCMIGFAAGGIGAYTAVEAGTSAWVTAGAVAKGALTGGFIIGAVAAVYVYRKEIAEMFETAWQGLKSLVSSLFSVEDNLFNVVMEMVQEILNTLWQLEEALIEWLKDVFLKTNKISKEDKLTMIDAVGSFVSAMDEAVDSFGEKVDVVARKAGISTEGIKDALKNILKVSREKLQKMTDKVKAN